jgi:predicted alpha/beta hydrolase family esterase
MQMRARPSFLILHGLENYRPPGHWQYWLATQLERSRYRVFYPALPGPDSPSLAAWTAALHTLLTRMDSEERVVICHSLACLLWFHVAPALGANEYVERLLLVSPPASHQLPGNAATFGSASFDLAAVRSSVRSEIRIVCSDSDPYNRPGAHGLYAQPLGTSATVLNGAGHITPADGYGPWPSLQAWCADPREPITSNAGPQKRIEKAVCSTRS